ncbi:hypothetical protein BDN70DRAFT_939343 [Pholiota conissans]|uniref:Uncharacterized protein n=1 Tax=Pholiota conissans TaxID=109636 RepID=A0A9P6CSU0_9AGAR|nr:hypothetical protein BDN70DRAFT_939343 [Pholiota conissans]
MANLVRSAKSGSNWTQAELDAYNITVISQDAATFFGVPHLPQLHVSQELLAKESAIDMVDDKNAELINLLDLAMGPSSEDSAVDDFAVELFKMLAYVRRHRIARTGKDIPLLICGEWKHAKADVCILDREQNDIMLLLLEDKRFGQGELSSTDAEAQLIAMSIAAFSRNNRCRVDTGLPEHRSKVIPGIVMVRTAPVFYKTEVISDLEYNIRHGLYPPNVTVVARHLPTVPRPNRRRSEGMKPLNSRSHIMRCYEAFKPIVGI